LEVIGLEPLDLLGADNLNRTIEHFLPRPNSRISKRVALYEPERHLKDLISHVVLPSLEIEYGTHLNLSSKCRT
jgi:hypothetical protein